MEKEELIGKKFTGIFINEDKTIIKFGDLFAIESQADCCSESWFDHICIGYSPFEDCKIISFEEIELGKVMPSRQEEDEIYGLKINIKNNRVNNDVIQIEMRNSSNGYYGGSFLYREINDSDSKQKFTKIEDGF